MKQMTFPEKFSGTGELTLILTGYEGQDSFGNHILGCEEQDSEGNVVSKGTLLYFRTNSLKDITINEDGSIADDHIKSRDGKWLTRPGSGIDTSDYGLVPVQAETAPVVK